jgi:branched-chain amino acid aminotransferase
MIGKWHYFNGKWVQSKDVKLSVFDLAILRGYGCFDLLRTYKNKPFKLKEHLQRFFNSAKFLGLKVPLSSKEIEKIVYLGIKKNKFPETLIRIILTGGISKDSLSLGKPSLIVVFTEAKNYPKSYYEKGVKVFTFKEKRIFPLVKSLNYLQGVYALNLFKKQGVIEVLHVDDEKIYEGSTSNFFAVIKSKLVTPKENILKGITRQVVLELAQKLNIPFEERNIYLKEIKNFESAFITSSTREIMPVIQIDDVIINKGKISELVKRLMVEFKNFVYNYS